MLELVRNALIFLPIAVTWAGLAFASGAYESLLKERPNLSDQPFLYLWQQDFFGRGYGLTFSLIATVDAVLIGLIIVLSAVIHYRIDINDAERVARSLLKSSEVRSVLGNAAQVADTTGLADDDADLLLRRMAEEKRAYDRVIAREDSLVDLQVIVSELRVGSEQLASFGDRTAASQERTQSLVQTLVLELDKVSKRNGQLASAIEGLAARITDAAGGSGAINGLAASALIGLEGQQRAVTAEASQLVTLLDAMAIAQRDAGAAVSSQALAIHDSVNALGQSTEGLGRFSRELATIGQQLPVSAQQLTQAAIDLRTAYQRGANFVFSRTILLIG